MSATRELRLRVSDDAQFVATLDDYENPAVYNPTESLGLALRVVELRLLSMKMPDERNLLLSWFSHTKAVRADDIDEAAP